MEELNLCSRVCRFAGEYGTGKSTLLEATAAHYGFGDKLDEDPAAHAPPIKAFYGGRSLHTRPTERPSLLCSTSNLGGTGYFCCTNPEAALSPQRQLSFLVLVHEVLQKYKDAQFIISTHSPIILGYPDAQILSFDDGQIHEVEFEDATSLQRRAIRERPGEISGGITEGGLTTVREWEPSMIRG